MDIAKSKVFIKYDGVLEKLASKLQDVLNTPEFWYKSGQEPPHDIVAMSECLGFELWLYSSTDRQGFNYALEFESTFVGQNSNEIQSHDISVWFVRYLKTVSELLVEA